MLIILLFIFCHLSPTQKKRRPRVAYSQIEAFALPLRSNKQQETYAGMKTHYTLYKCSMDIFIPIGIY